MKRKFFKMDYIFEICKRLDKSIKEPKSELHYHSDYMFLIAVVLSAQSTDKRANIVVDNLFKKYKTIDDILTLSQEKLEEEIKTIGLYRNKAKNILALSKILKGKYNSQIPRKREELEELPGVGRKTSNVILNTLFHEKTIAVDTHVLRLSKRLELSKSSLPIDVEGDLEKAIPEEYKGKISDLLVLHGRYICKAIKPNCENCVLNDICPSYSKKNV